MSLPVFTKTWDFQSLNNHITFVSLNDTMGSWGYGQKNYLVTTRGATLTWSCDGTTGPTNSSDHTDRITDKTKFETRATVAAAAQSWFVISWAGVQLLMTYQGASDDIARISFSPGSNFALAGTTTNQPTASDECVLVSGTSIINSTASADRVWSIEAATDSTVFRSVLCRQNAIAIAWGLEQLSPAPNVIGTPIVGWSYNAAYSSSFSSSTGGVNATPAAANSIGSTIARVNSVNVQMQTGSFSFEGQSVSVNMFDANPELNSGCPIFPAAYASVSSSNTGWYGTRYDNYCAFANGAVLGQVFDDISQSTRCVMVGCGGIWPWDPTKGFTAS